MTVRAEAIVPPQDLARPDRITRGAGLYDAMCGGCHLTPAQDDSELRRGLYPKPPNFPLEGEDDPAMAFWAIKHGVKMTAMPAWGSSHSDAQIWDMVAFLLRSKGMSAADYEALVASAPPDDDEHEREHAHGGCEH
jgi:mono/diheme cytochrome c family protein